MLLEPPSSREPEAPFVDGQLGLRVSTYAFEPNAERAARQVRSAVSLVSTFRATSKTVSGVQRPHHLTCSCAGLTTFEFTVCGRCCPPSTVKLSPQSTRTQFYRVLRKVKGDTEPYGETHRVTPSSGRRTSRPRRCPQGRPSATPTSPRTTRRSARRSERRPQCAG